MKLSDGIIPFSPQWHEARSGKLTSSLIHKIFVNGTGAKMVGTGGITYIDQKIGEMLTGVVSDEIEGNIPKDIERGLANEPWAIERYTEITGVEVNDSLLFEYNAIAAGTTDGQVCDSKGNITSIIECKSPRAWKHSKICAIESPIELKGIDPQYWHQCQANTMFTNSDHGDFISYNDDLKHYDLQVRIIRIYPDMEWRKDFIKRIDWVAGYMNDQIEKILKTPERNLAYRIEKKPEAIKNLKAAIENIQNIKP